MTDRLPTPYASAAIEPREPRTIGRCAQCQDPFDVDETGYRIACDDSALVHQGCCLDYLLDRELIDLGPVMGFLRVWEWEEE